MTDAQRKSTQPPSAPSANGGLGQISIKGKPVNTEKEVNQHQGSNPHNISTANEG